MCYGVFMSNDTVITVERIDYHRNGVSGEGFHVVAFVANPEYAGEVDQNMFAVVFEDRGHCAVFDRDLLGQGTIEFGANSWRGDNFEPLLREVIDGFNSRCHVADDSRDGGYRYDVEAIIAPYPPKPIRVRYGSDGEVLTHVLEETS